MADFLVSLSSCVIRCILRLPFALRCPSSQAGYASEGPGPTSAATGCGAFALHRDCCIKEAYEASPPNRFFHSKHGFDPRDISRARAKAAARGVSILTTAEIHTGDVLGALLRCRVQYSVRCGASLAALHKRLACEAWSSRV